MPENSSEINKDAESSELEGILNNLSRQFELEFEPLDIDGRQLQILNIANMPTHIDRLLAEKKIRNPLYDLPLWAKVWPSSFILGRFLRKCNPAGKTMLELGAGMGICSLVASAYDLKQITLSDANAQALDFARANILKNGLQNKIRTSLVEIGIAGQALKNEAFDIITASELLYLDKLHRPLLKFIHGHLSRGGQAIFCTDRARLKPGFKKLAEKEFSIQEGHIGVKTEEDGEKQQRVYNILILEEK